MREKTLFLRLASIGAAFAMVRNQIKCLPILQSTHFCLDDQDDQKMDFRNFCHDGGNVRYLDGVALDERIDGGSDKIGK